MQSENPAQNGPNITNRLRNRALAVTLAAGLVVSACATSGHSESSAPRASIGKSAVVTPECYDPTAADIQAADALLAQPENPILNPNLNISDGKEGSSQFENDLQTLYHQTANELGLTIYDGSSVSYPLEEIINKAQVQPPFETFFEPTKGFLEKFGVTIQVGTPDMKFAYGGRAPTTDELDDGSASQTMINLINTFSDTPVEYVHASNLKHIVLVTGTEAQDVAGYADVDGEANTIYIDVSKDLAADFSIHGIRHEMYHLMDREDCETAAQMVYDGGFTNLNTGNIYNGDWHNDSIPSLDTYGQEVQQNYQSNPDNLDDQAADHAADCKMEAEDVQDGAMVETYSDYFPNPAEDKAEIGAELSDVGGYEEATDPATPIYDKKFAFLFARLYAKYPKIAKYFAAISPRSALAPSNPDALKC